MLTDLKLFKLWSAIQSNDPEMILQTPSFLLRAASLRDVKGLAELLTISFHSDDRWIEILHPILRFGIYEDLRHRIQFSTAPYTCIVALRHTDAADASCVGSSDYNSSDDTILSPFTMFDLFSHDESHKLVANRSHKQQRTTIVGTVEVSVKRRPLSFLNSQYVYVSNLATHPNHRRQGVAQHLLEGCEMVAQRWGFQETYLHVLENNTGARSLYQKLGYQIKQSESSLTTLLFGQPKQLLLVKALSTPDTLAKSSDHS